MMNSSHFSSSTTMESVRHILIRTCMSQIQKELGHLEHWLIHLPEEPKTTVTDLPAPSVLPTTSATSTDIQRLVTSVEQLTKQLELQQLTLDQIIRRLAVLESVKGVHIDSDSDSPWMDDAPAPFVPDNSQEEVVYIVHKTDVEEAVEEAVEAVAEAEEEVKQEEAPVQVVEVKQEEPVQDVQVVEVKKEEPIQVVEVKQEEPVQDVQVVEVKQEEPVQDVQDVQVVEVKQEEPVQDVQVVEVKQEEPIQVVEVKEEEEEEEEEDVELEEICYQGEVYYRDPQQFVYSVNDEGEVSEDPIGYWKAKTKSIAFYNKK